MYENYGLFPVFYGRADPIQIMIILITIITIIIIIMIIIITITLTITITITIIIRIKIDRQNVTQTPRNKGTHKVRTGDPQIGLSPSRLSTGRRRVDLTKDYTNVGLGPSS